SVRVNPSQDSGLPDDFLGVAIGGPSREGVSFAPAYRVRGGGQGQAGGEGTPRIDPHGTPSPSSLGYFPPGAGGRGGIAVRLGKQSVGLDLKEGDRAAGARFARFGMITTWVDGNGQHVSFDDLTYTVRQE